MTTRDLILWRHADAGDPSDDDGDMARPLTTKGEKQAQRMANWLKRQLPESARVITSPATRAEQTAKALNRPIKLRAELEPSATAQDVLTASQWGSYRGTTLVVGHQPSLGEAVGLALRPGWNPLAELKQADDRLVSPISIRKGALWWLRLRIRDDQTQVVVVCVQTPELL